MMQEEVDWLITAVRNRHLFVHPEKPDTLAVKEEVSSSRPFFRHRALTVPEWPNTRESGNRVRWLRAGTETLQPCFHLLAGKLVRVQPQNPVVRRLPPSERPVRFLLIRQGPLE